MEPKVTVSLPDEYRQYEHIIRIQHEEEAICWLWAFQSLISWSNDIVWLYTPVVGRHRWPGDLWGIDDKGDLLIIEAKRCVRKNDAFNDFEEYHSDGRHELSAQHWEHKWKKHFIAEIEFPDCITQRPEGKTDGILPRSNGRKHIRRWPELAKQIDFNIRTHAYQYKVMQNLDNREKANNPRPFYLALMIQVDTKRTTLNGEAIASAERLQKKVGRDRVFAMSIVCEKLDSKSASINASRIGLLQ